MRQLLLLLSMLLSLVPQSSHALARLAHVPIPNTNPTDVAINGNLAYVATGVYHASGGVVVVDFGVPTAPVIVGSLALPKAVNAAAVVGGYLYLAGEAGLEVFDLSNPLQPQFVTARATPPEALTMDVQGSLVFVGTYYDQMNYVGQLLIFDATNPASPQQVGNLDFPAEPVYDVAVSGNYALLALFGSYALVNVAAPASPVLVKRVVGTATGVELIGATGYVLGGSSVLIVDLSNPVVPLTRATIPVTPYEREVTVNGGVAYLAGPSLRLFDVTSPYQPVELAGILSLTGAGSVDVLGALIVVAETYGISFVDGANSDYPAVLASRSVGYFGVSGGPIVAARGPGLSLVDVVNPLAPQVLSTIANNPRFWESIQIGPYLYATDDFAFKVFDVSVPASPLPLGTLPTTYAGTDFAMRGTVAYIPSTTGLHVVQASDPLSPTLVTTIPGRYGPIAIEGKNLYVLGSNGAPVAGISTFDLSNPIAPTPIGGLPLFEVCGDLQTLGTRLYLTCVAKVQELDATNPAQPHVVTTYPNYSSTARIAPVCAGFYYSDSNTYGGVRFVRRDGLEVGGLPLLARSSEVELNGSTLVASHGQGLSTIDFGPEYPTDATSCALDSDLDSVLDARDNCVNEPNPNQSDVGGIGAASGPDGIGDACQCGDVSGNGRVTTADATLITRALLVPPTATLARPDLCNVGGNASCTTADAVIATRALLVPPTATVQQVCAPALP